MTRRRTLTLERCEWCGDYFGARSIGDVRLTDRTARVCIECRERLGELT